MPTLRLFSDVLQEIRGSRKTGALFVGVKESSEDLLRIYFRNGDIYHLTYGSAIGQDCMEIIEFYTWQNATFLEGLAAPPGTVASKFKTDAFISTMKKAGKTVKVP